VAALIRRQHDLVQDRVVRRIEPQLGVVLEQRDRERAQPPHQVAGAVGHGIDGREDVGGRLGRERPDHPRHEAAHAARLFKGAVICLLLPCPVEGSLGPTWAFFDLGQSPNSAMTIRK
jgi:hypothetical protein